MKHLFTLTLLCFGLMAQAQIPRYVPTNGLVGWWPFNGNANDESGNGNNGTVNGATLAADRFGNAGKAYSFDGVDDNIYLSNFIASNQAFSTSAWFKLNSYNFDGRRILTGNSVTSIAVLGGVSSFGNVFEICLEGVGCYQIAGAIPLDSLIHFSTIFSSGLLEIYLNGKKSLSVVNLPPISSSNNAGFVIGGGTIWTFHGLLDDIAIYNRALSAAEVQQLYSGCITQPTFTAQPQNKSVAQGQTTTFGVQVDSASSFQWQMNLGLGAGWTNIPASALFSGDTTATLTVEGRNPLDGARFRCIATSCNSDTSNAATLTVSSSATAAAGAVSGVPGLINYQGSALDSAGKPLKNQTISLKLSVLDSSSTGAAVFVETHTATTNGSGHFAIQIGGGTAILGTFDSVGWANGRNKYLKTELSQNGTWVNLGTSQLVSVPYALHAGSASYASQAGTLRDSSGNAYQIKTVNGQPTLVAAPGSGNASNPGSFACGQAVNYAGETYPTVQIGTQCWFQKNLNVGTMILGANDQTNNNTLEKYCYNNDPSNCDIYGGLYQWAEAVQYQNGASNTTAPSPAFSGNVKGICPTGWHVPSDGDWCKLTTFLDSTINCSVFVPSISIAGGALKSMSGLWIFPNSGATNTSGFSALPGPVRAGGGGGNFNSQIGENTTFWSSSFSSINSHSIAIQLMNATSSLSVNNYPKYDGYSIRCLKD